MKGSKGSQYDRQPPTTQQNRLHKTQQPQPPKQQFLENSYQVPKKPITKSIHSQKTTATMPPRTGSTQKINYKVQDNMTNSKIHEAKMGLQLLKKKMSRNGMSREKNQRTSFDKREDEYNPRKTVIKQQDNLSYDKKPTPPLNQKKSEKTPPIPRKTQEDRPLRKQQSKQQYINSAEQVPIKANQDFMAILEREMAKQKQGSQPIKVVKKAQNFEIPENQQVEMVECTRGCGRQFSVNVIEKHQKVCEKVFQSKRKVFNSAAFRQPEAEGDFNKPPPPPIREQKPRKKNKEEKVPKWKLQSAAFRAGIKQGRGQELTAEEKAVAEQASGMVQCGCCGRKFNQDAAKRHIPVCERKSKEMPRMNTTKRR